MDPGGTGGVLVGIKRDSTGADDSTALGPQGEELPAAKRMAMMPPPPPSLGGESLQPGGIHVAGVVGVGGGDPLSAAAAATVAAVGAPSVQVSKGGDNEGVNSVGVDNEGVNSEGVDKHEALMRDPEALVAPPLDSLSSFPPRYPFRPSRPPNALMISLR